MINEAGFSRERERLLKEGPTSKLASERAAFSFTSPALTVIVAAAPLLSAAHCPFIEAFHMADGSNKTHLSFVSLLGGETKIYFTTI